MGRLLWFLWKAAARNVVSLVPKSERQERLIQRLKAEVAGLPAFGPRPRTATLDFWAAAEDALRHDIGTRDPRAFLTWDVVTRTMFVPFARYLATELAYLKRRSDWSRWRSAIREPWTGCPFPYPLFPLTSGNAIHHAYHLCLFEEWCGLRVHEFSTVFEFGGGYGSMCRICRSLGFSGLYVTYDLPALSALQRYYLAAVGSDACTLSDVGTLKYALEGSSGPRLFIATWSLSESPVKVRHEILQFTAAFDAFLIAYQDRFEGQDNIAYFSGLDSILPEISWETRVIGHLPGNFYLFGRRSGRS